jgi:hypothetical protein
LGPDQDAAAVYNWKWYYSTPSLALWLVLLAAFVFFKANRKPRVLLILVPLLILNVLWLLLRQAMGFSSSADVEMFNMMFYSLVAGVTFLWLFADKLGRYNRWAAFLLAFALMAVFFLLGIVSYLGLEFSQEALVALIMLAMVGLAILLGFVLAGWRCRRRYGPVRFMLWLAVWTVAACLVNTLALYLLWFIFSEVPVPVFAVLLMAAVFGSVLGLILYAVVFPYMILALCSSFFRERFYVCLRLKPRPATAVQTASEAFVEQNPGTQTSEDSGSV